MLWDLQVLPEAPESMGMYAGILPLLISHRLHESGEAHTVKPAYC